MTKQFKTFLVLSAIAFFILGIYLVVTVGNISISYDGGGYYGASINEDYLAQRIAEEMAKQQQNLFSSVKAELLSPDPEAMTIEFSVTAIPREFADSTTALLLVGDQRVSMQQKDGVFNGRVAIPLSGQMSSEYTIVLQDGKQYRTQVTSLELKEFAPGWQVFGMENWGMSGGYRPQVDYNLEQGIVLDETLLPFGDKAVSARIFALEDEKEIYTEALKNGQLKISHTFELKVGVPVWLCGEVVGASGLTYRYRLLEIQRENQDNMTVNTLESTALQMITPEGKTIDLPVY